MFKKTIIILLLCVLPVCFVLTGCNKDNTQDNIKDNIQEDVDTGGIGNKDIPTYDKLENYIEEEIFLDSRIDENEEWYVSSVLNENSKLELYTVSTKEDKADSFIWKYTLADNQWEREAVIWLNALKEKVSQRRITVLLGEDGNYYAHYVDADERSHLIKKVGDDFSEITIIDWDKTSERDFYMIPDQVAVLKNGNIVMASRNRTCYIYDKEGGAIIDSFKCGWYTSLITKDDNIIILDQDNQSVMVYDANQLKLARTIRADFDARTLITSEGNELIACNSKGIYKTELGADEFCKILEPQVFKFTNPSEVLVKFFAVNDCFYVLYGETGVRLMRYSPNKNRTQDQEKDELNIFSLEYSEAVSFLVSEFQLRHPDIAVTYETGLNNDGATTKTDIIRALNTRIMAQDGPDLLILDGLPAESYIKKNILLDISEEIMDIKEALHPGIINAYTKAGSVYMLPVRFSVPIVLTTSESSSEAGSLESLIEYSESKEGHILGEMTYEAAFDWLYRLYKPDLFSTDKETDKDELENFLRLVKRFCDAEGVSDNSEGNYYNDSLIDFAAGRTEVVFREIVGISSLWDLPKFVEDRGGEIVSCSDFFTPIGLLGVNKTSENIAEATLFIREALSYEAQSLKTTGRIGFPVHKEVLEELKEYDFSHLINSYGSKETGESFEARMFNKEEAAEMIEMVLSVSKAQSADETLQQIIIEEAEPFLNGTEGLPDTIAKIMNRVNLILYE